MGDATPTTPVKLPPPPEAPWWTDRRLRNAAFLAVGLAAFVAGLVVGWTTR